MYHWRREAKTMLVFALFIKKRPPLSASTRTSSSSTALAAIKAAMSTSSSWKRKKLLFQKALKSSGIRQYPHAPGIPGAAGQAESFDADAQGSGGLLPAGSHDYQDRERGLEYARKRGLDDDLLKHFKIGYAPGKSDLLLTYLRGEGYTDDQLAESGLFVKSQDGRLFDHRFRDRLMFPMSDESGHPLATPAGESAMTRKNLST